MTPNIHRLTDFKYLQLVEIIELKSWTNTCQFDNESETKKMISSFAQLKSNFAKAFMIRALNENLGIPLDVLIQDPENKTNVMFK